jgi:FkbM family methyltransferase
LLKSVKDVLRSAARTAGYDIRRRSVESDPMHRLVVALQRFAVDVVFDVGANAGQFATSLRSAGYAGRIVSFEPLPEPHARLCEQAVRDPLWQVHPRGALGDRDGEVVINVAANSLSSSALPMLPLHEAAAQGSAYVGSECVPLCRLDGIADTYLREGNRAFLKIDTQGFEWQVLDGAEATLPRCVGVLCELSFVPLYADQKLWRAMLERFERAGYTLWGLQPGFADPRDARMLQADATFFRP